MAANEPADKTTTATPRAPANPPPAATKPPVPAKPGNAATPGKPAPAGKPGKPANAGKPGKPANAGKPGKPANAGKPGEPDRAAARPANLEKALQPVKAGNAGKPGKAGKPDMQAKQGRQGVPGQQGKQTKQGQQHDAGGGSPAIRIGIGGKDRRRIADGLSRFLADSYTLYLKTHNFHWNVTGPMFNSLHAMFMTQYTEQWTALDEIAERIRALGFPAPGSYAEFVKLSSIREESGANGVPRWQEMVRQLVDGNEAVCRTARKVLDIADDADDEPTEDLLVQRLQIHEKYAWMLRSLLE